MRKVRGVIVLSFLAIASLLLVIPRPVSAQSFLVVTTDKSVYAIGEIVHITLTYEGPTVTLTFPTPCISTFNVIGVFQPVIGCVQVIVIVKLTPGEIVGSFSWNQVDNLGKQVPPGTYVIEGILGPSFEGFTAFGFTSVIVFAPPPPPSPKLRVSEFFTDSSLNPLPLDGFGNPMVNVVLARSIVESTNPGQVLAWVNVTNTAGVSLQSLKLIDELPSDWMVDPPWMPALGAIHVYFANTTTLASNPEITQPSTITATTGNPQGVMLAISNFTATGLGHPLMPGQSILLSVKLTYTLIGTSQSASSYPRTYTDTAFATAWTQPSFTGTASGGGGSAFFTADAKVVGSMPGERLYPV